jgi:hypothetical protein
MEEEFAWLREGMFFLALLPHLKCGQATKSVGCRKPAEFIQDPLPQKTAEDLSPEERASAPGCPLRSGDRKRAGFSVELMVSNDQQTVHKLRGAVQFTHDSLAAFWPRISWTSFFFSSAH